MPSHRRRDHRGVVRVGPEDRLLVTAIRHHQALRDRELWRQEISGSREKPKMNGGAPSRRDPRDGFAAGIARVEFGRFYFKEPTGKSPQRGK